MVPICKDLPRELVDIVTNHLKQDIEALKTCSLLGPIWAASARAYFFYQVKVFTTRRGRSITILLKVLKSAPAMADCIRELCLHGSATGNAIRTIDAETVSMLLENLPRLQMLSLQDLEYGKNLKNSITSSRFKLATLTIKCRCISQRSLRTFMEILSVFSEVEELYLQEYPYLITPTPISVAKPQDPIDDPHLHAPTIRAVLLQYKRFQVSSLLNDYLRVPPNGLKKLRVTVYDVLDLKSRFPAGQEYEPHLDELEVQLVYNHWGTANSYLRLSSGSSMPTPQGSERSEPTVSPSQLQEVEMQFGCDPELNAISPTDWKHIINPSILSAIHTVSLVLPDLIYGVPNSVLTFLEALPAGSVLRHIHMYFVGSHLTRTRQWWTAFDHNAQRFANLVSISAWKTSKLRRITGSWLPDSRPELTALDRQSLLPEYKAFLIENLPMLHERGLLRLE